MDLPEDQANARTPKPRTTRNLAGEAAVDSRLSEITTSSRTPPAEARTVVCSAPVRPVVAEPIVVPRPVSELLLSAVRVATGRVG